MNGSRLLIAFGVVVALAALFLIMLVEELTAQNAWLRAVFLRSEVVRREPAFDFEIIEGEARVIHE